MKLLFLISFIIVIIDESIASTGDISPHFSNCYSECEHLRCSVDSVDTNYTQSFVNKLLLWSCEEECQYECMWETVEDFTIKGLQIPQFYGAWPFVRFLGLQQPASSILSIFNIITHVHQSMKFRNEIRPHSPCYGLYHILMMTSVNCWIWSTVYHARDFPFPEFMDNISAYLAVLSLLYILCMRVSLRRDIISKGIITTLFAVFYLQYLYYLAIGRISYSFNLEINIYTGLVSGLAWITWCFRVRKRRPYCKWMVGFYISLGLASVFEIMDFPPIFWVFDAHSLWHLSTVPITFFLYKFLMEDCKFLRKEKYLF